MGPKRLKRTRLRRKSLHEDLCGETGHRTPAPVPGLHFDATLGKLKIYEEIRPDLHWGGADWIGLRH